MALVLADRVLETTPVAGTGDANLSGAVTGYQPFSTIGGGNTTYYTIVAIDDQGAPTGDWEVGIGTYVTTGNKLTRDTVLSSSNGGNKVYFASGTKQIFLDLPSEELNLNPGDVFGPSSAVADHFASFNMTTGKLIKDSGYSAASFATAAQGAKADTAVQPGSLGTAAYLNAGVANGVATLDSGGQVPLSQIPPLGDLNYQGAWNASSNTPTLVSSSGTKGYYYVVSVAGTTNLNGITDWQIGDWAVFNGSVWQKIDNTDSVNSVNGKTGTVVLTYSDVGAFPATSTTGSGNVVLQTGATLNNPTIGNYEAWTSATKPSYTEGLQWYDSTQHCLAYYNDSANAIVHIGQDLQLKVINNTGSTIPNGSPVYITGTSSGQTYPNVALAKADVAATASVIGLTNGAITNGSIGYVTSNGGIDGVNTGTFTVGQVLYLSPYSAGQLMNTIPPTGITVQVGLVSYVDSTNGKIYVKQTTPLAIPASIITGTLGVANGGTGAITLTGYVKGSGMSALTANSTIPTTDLSGTITNAQLANSSITINGTTTSLGGSISVGTVTSVSGTAPIASTGGATPTISISQATTSTSGYLSSTDWNTFNNKQPAGSYLTTVTATTPLSGSGTVGSPLVIAQATTSTSGYLSSTDWNTFNNKGSGTVTSVTGTAPVVSSGGTTPAISMAKATGSVDGYLSSTDWTTFNSKQPAGTYVTAVTVVSTNGFTGTSSGGATPALTLGTSITGLLKGNGTAISAATSGTDYAPATSGSSILYGNGAGGFSNVTVGTGLSFSAGTLSATATGVTSLAGTANQITASASTGAVTLSVPSTFIAPGSIAATTTVSGTITNATNGIHINSNTVGATYSIPSGSNAMSAGPITIASGQTVTVPSGSRWVVV